MPAIPTHQLLWERSAPPVFGRPGFEYFEIDGIEGGAALVDGKSVGSLDQREIAPNVARVTLVPDGMPFRSLDDLIEVPGDGRLLDSLQSPGGVYRYHRSHGAQRNTALPLGFARDETGPTICFDSFDLDHDDELYGLGERHLTLRVRGSRERLWIGDPYVNTTSTPVYLQVPLILSTAGWGVAVLNGGGVIVEAGNPTSNALTIAVEGSGLDYLLLSGGSIAANLALVAGLFGKPNMPPIWSLGIWISRAVYFSRKEVEEMLDALDEAGFPYDVVHLDPQWHASDSMTPIGIDRTTFVWNENDFSPLQDFMDEMSRRKARVSLWESPYLRSTHEIYEEAKRRGFLLKTPEGEIAGPDDLDIEAGIVDFTNPDAARWWGEVHRPLLEAGASVIKTDFGESVPANAVFSDGRTGADLHNLYALLYHRAVAEIGRDVRGDDFAIWARSGFFGSAVHDIPWVGDSVSTWEGMACALRSVLSLSMSGYPFASVDIGGFILWDELVGPPEPELFVRWSQWGLLLSHSRFHGVGGREPVLIAKPERSMVLEMCRRRMQWLPYIHELCRRAAATGEPVVRPLAYTWPHDPSARADELSFTLGPSVLVAPVMSPGGRRLHYLPSGEWVDHFTGASFEGGRWVDEEYPVNRFPLYIRRGDEIPEAAPAMRAEDAIG